MNILIPILQILGVAAGSFAVFALLVSYLRYRKMQLISLDQVEGEMELCAAVMVILTTLQEDKHKLERTLLLFEPGADTDASVLRDFLRKNLRKEDQVFLLKQGRVLAFLQCPEEHLAATARRMVPVLNEAGYTEGRMCLSLAARDADALRSLLETNLGSLPSEGWSIQPADWRDRVFPDNDKTVADHKEEGPTTVSSVSVDPLTGVLKLDLVPGAVRRMLASQRRAGCSVTIVRVDPDGLESYNATYGRKTGDRILRKTASILMANCRESDLIGRMEDDALILCMAGKNEDIQHAARRMSEQIKNSLLEEGETQIRFSAAFGLASMPTDGRNPVVLLERADWALQEAKRRGRGMCVAFQPALKPKSSKATAGENRPESF